MKNGARPENEHGTLLTDDDRSGTHRTHPANLTALRRFVRENGGTVVVATGRMCVVTTQRIVDALLTPHGVAVTWWDGNLSDTRTPEPCVVCASGMTTTS